jgi:hypothetical protein
MSATGWLRSIVATAVFALGATCWAPSVGAEIIAPQHPGNPQVDDGWQAGTCSTDTPTCSVATTSQFFEQAAGHPQVGFTQFIVREEPKEILPSVTVDEPVGDIKDVRVDLPVGLSVNPQATPSCEQAVFEANPALCPAGSAVGESLATAVLLGIESPQLPATVYNIEPPSGEPARFGFNLLGNNVYLKAGVAWNSDYHEFFTIEAPTSPVGHVLKNRLVFKGRSGNGTFITTPTTCNDPADPSFQHVYSTYLRADSHQEEDPDFPNGSPFIESELPPGTSPKECDTIPLDPSVETTPNTTQTDSPDAAAVEVKVPFVVPTPLENAEPLTKQASSHVRTASVTLPAGMGLNPSAANGLQACSNDQFGKGTRQLVACPAPSKIGTVSIETPPLPPGSLSGNVYLGQQLSRDPASGEEFRIFVDAESDRYGISARLIGHVAADPQTGRLTTTFAETPQVPFSSFKLKFDGRPTAPLTSPGSCGPHTTMTTMTPWSGNPPTTAESGFVLTSAPGGGACPKTLAERPFAPGFGAGTGNSKAGAFSKFHLDLTRSDGEQELKGATVDLPPGLTAKLAGVKYCHGAALAAAAANSGIAEAASPSCPASSLVGTASIISGSGPSPLHIDGGKAFLTGPYHGAPLSLAVVTPATAGPFDLGSVVVRVALLLDRETAQVHAVSDPIPHVFGGALLDIRSIELRLDRPQFSLNPTNCSQMAVGGTLQGGGANPADPAAFSSFPVSTPFKVNGCEALDFKPKLFFRLFGATRRAKNPRLRAVLIARKGDANIGSAVVALPNSIILDQSSIANVCTRVQFAASDCPKDSVYGFARAFSPLLDKPLEGPVRLRSSDNLLPDLVASLQGQVDIDLVGRIDSVKGRIRNSFDRIPDVPISKFVLTVRGGKTGLLTNTRNICGKGAGTIRANAKFTAQNGKKANQRPKLRRPCDKKKKKK